MSMTRTQEARWDFDSYLNTAREAAHAGKVAEVNYFLSQAHQEAWYLGWRDTQARFFAVQDECIAIVGGRHE